MSLLLFMYKYVEILVKKIFLTKTTFKLSFFLFKINKIYLVEQDD
jgi:hypothetical protein